MLFFLRSADYPIPTMITFAIVLVFAFAYHELAHAVTADRLGDPTPRSYGRITLNPAPNLDRTGLILALLIGFGWAFTPINPLYFRGNPRRAFAIVAIAGPLANLAMAGLMGLPVRLGLVTYTPPMEVLPSLYSFLTFGVYYNLLLFAFNLIPIPPLDGFRILLGILPPDIAVQLEQMYRYSMFIFLGVFFLLPAAGVDVVGQILWPVIGFFYPIFTGGWPPII
ncbi:MAG TPA: site-2 protease family protein [Chloroflexota bacterium]|nr:site-2 protease family protein [Chloroflexota bacterium]HUM71978.1 site-2 protease family protein [Chloroflexota bacterium]